MATLRARPATRPRRCGCPARPVTGSRRGATLGDLGYYELAAGELEAARGHLVEALDIARAFKARDGIVLQTFNLGLAEYLGGSPDAAEVLFAESLDLARRMGMSRARLRADRPGPGRPRRG